MPLSKYLLFFLFCLQIVIANSPKDLAYILFSKEIPSQTATFEEASDYCERLTLYGLSDWQLPNTKELQYIATSTKQKNSYGIEGYIEKEILEYIDNNNSLDFWSSEPFEPTIVSFEKAKDANNTKRVSAKSLHQVFCVHPKPVAQYCYILPQKDFIETLEKKSNILIEVGELLYPSKDNHAIHISFSRKNIPHTSYNIDFYCNKEKSTSPYICSSDEDGGEMKIYLKDKQLSIYIDYARMSYILDDPIIHSIKSKNNTFTKGIQSICPSKDKLWADVNFQATAEDALFNAASVGDINGILEALDDGADIDSLDNRGFSALLVGIEYPDVVRLLLNYDADTTINTELYKSLLIPAIEEENPEIIQLLLNNGEDASLEEIFSDIDEKGEFTVDDLFALGNEEIATLLIVNGAKVDIKDEKGYTPIYKAVLAKNMYMLELLIKYKAKLDTVYENNQTLRSKACAEKWEEGCMLLSNL